MQDSIERAQKAVSEATSIGRLLDPRYPTNLAIMALTPLLGGIAALLTLLVGEGLVDAFWTGFYSGAAVFLAWALAREFDPDHEWQAFIGSGLAFIGALIAPQPSLWALGALLVLVRVVNRIVGPPARISDSAFGLALSLLAIFTGWWVFGVVAAAAFALDALLPSPNRRQWVFAGVALAAALVSIVLNAANKPYEPSNWTLPVLIAAGVIAYVIATTKVTSPCDLPDFPTDNRRIQAGMGLMLFAGVLFELWAGTPGLIALLPLWAMMIGLTVWRLWESATTASSG